MAVWEVLIQEDDATPLKNVGSVRAPDAELALQFAREVYARRESIVRLMVVDRRDIYTMESPDTLAIGPNKRYRLPSLGHQRQVVQNIGDS